MAGYYVDEEKKKIRPELLDEDAKKIVDQLIKTSFDSRQNKEVIDSKPSVSVSSSQLRKFFYEFRNLEKKVNLKDKDFDEVLPLIKMVKSKAMYAANPKSKKIPDSFEKFLTSNVDSISDQQDFKAFMLHFEAVVGFCYGRGLK